MKARRHWFRGATVMIAAAMSVGIPTAAGAQPSDDTAALVRYAAQNPSATHLVIKGTPVAGGCAFTATGTGDGAAAKSSATTARTIPRYSETAYNPKTCESFVDRIDVPFVAEPAGALPDGAAGGSGGGSGKVSGPSAVNPLVARCNNPYRDTSRGYSHDACIHMWFEDPPGIHVNDVRNEVQWNPASGCASYGYAYASYYWTLLWQTGWWNTVDIYSPSFTCSGVTSRTTEIFQNDLFCATTISGTAYDPSYITGYANGSYYWSVSWRKVGLCQALLSFHYQDET